VEEGRGGGLTWMCDNGELAVCLLDFQLSGIGFDTQSVVIGCIDDHICRSVGKWGENRMRTFVQVKEILSDVVQPEARVDWRQISIFVVLLGVWKERCGSARLRDLLFCGCGWGEGKDDVPEGGKECEK
jgi:hypothetical protein